MKHFLTLLDLEAAQLRHLLQDAAQMKTAHLHGQRAHALTGKVLGLVFEKPSLRTRVSFEAAMLHLGGTSIFLSTPDGAMGVRESVPDFARTLCQYVDVVALRTYKHATVEEFARHATCPVINALSDQSHPCQALADLLTIQEVFGDVEGRTLVFVGDGNNVARELAVGCGLLGARFILASPEGYGFDEPFLEKYREHCDAGELVMNGDPSHAVDEADVIYTDVWTSMGQEAEHDKRVQQFQGFQVNAALMAKAPPQARFMHCLPAHRGEEVTGDVLDGEKSIAFQQAGNRMHAQKALLKWLLVE
jgi:ornithine carbamoyltransferase